MLSLIFDPKTIELLNYYVYCLLDPRTKKPFYIGKGAGNRVFDHLNCALKKDNSKSLKYDVIREINKADLVVKHIIIRHQLSEKEAFEVEASLIDFSKYLGYKYLNLVDGHHSASRGLMTSEEIIRSYNSKPLKKLSDPCIIININKGYSRGKSEKDIYKATKQAWIISESKRKTIKYALSEYSGRIIGVYAIEKWYKVKAGPAAKIKDRWGFNGKTAPREIRDKYINKSISHHKKQGSANPIRYRL